MAKQDNLNFRDQFGPGNDTNLKPGGNENDHNQGIYVRTGPPSDIPPVDPPGKGTFPGEGEGDLESKSSDSPGDNKKTPSNEEMDNPYLDSDTKGAEKESQVYDPNL